MNESVNEKWDKAIAVINHCSLANYISSEKCNTLSTEILAVNNKKERNLASGLSELHEYNLKHYIETKQSTPEFSRDFVQLLIECISLLNEIEAALYIQDNLNPDDINERWTSS